MAKLSDKKKLAACARLAKGYSLTDAATSIGVSREALRLWRKADAVFDADCRAAIESGTDILEDIARKRAEEKSDLLLLALLNARRPEQFKQRQTIAFDRATPDQVADAISTMSDEKLRAILAKRRPVDAEPGDHAGTKPAPDSQG